MEAKKQGTGEEDLSMEDILQSIRRIIADDSDNAESKSAVSPGDNENEKSLVPVSDILELTDMIEDDGSITNLKNASAIDVLDNIDAALLPPVVEPATTRPMLRPG